MDMIQMSLISGSFSLTDTCVSYYLFQKGAYFVADRLTWVDFLIFDVLDYNVQYGLYDFGNKEYKVDVLEHFPKLNNFYRLLASRPNIEQYLKSDRRHQFVPFNLPQDAPKSS